METSLVFIFGPAVREELLTGFLDGGEEEKDDMAKDSTECARGIVGVGLLFEGRVTKAEIRANSGLDDLFSSLAGSTLGGSMTGFITLKQKKLH